LSKKTLLPFFKKKLVILFSTPLQLVVDPMLAEMSALPAVMKKLGLQNLI
jgi:hypothetical protein